MHPKVYMHELLTYSLTHSNINFKLVKFLYIHFRNFNECKMQLMSNGLNTSKMNDSTHVQMLIVQEM